MNQRPLKLQTPPALVRSPGMLEGSSGFNSSSSSSSSGSGNVGSDGAPPPKRQRTGDACPVIFVPVQGLQHGTARWRLWSKLVPGLGGKLAQLETDSTITHVIVPSNSDGSGHVSCNWRCVPKELQPAGKRQVQYVRETWLVESLALQKFQPADLYRCSPPAAPPPPTTAAAAATKLTWEQQQQQQAAAAATPEEQQAAVARDFHAAQQRAKRDRAAPAAPATAKQSFTLLTFNIWFEAACGPQRMAALWGLLQDLAPDVVLLQEVTVYLFVLLERHGLLGRYLCCTEPLVAVSKGQRLCTNLILVHKHSGVGGIEYLPPQPFRNSQHGRDCHYVRCSVGGTPWCVATSHLESRKSAAAVKGRPKQLAASLGLLHKEPEGANLVFAGDFNWLPLLVGGQQVEVKMPHIGHGGWVDVWEELRPGENGYTWNTAVNRQKGVRYSDHARLDRVQARLRGWEPVHIGLVGQHRIFENGQEVKRVAVVNGKEMKIPVWISDHMGLFCRFEREASK